MAKSIRQRSEVRSRRAGGELRIADCEFEELEVGSQRSEIGMAKRKERAA